MTAVPVILAGGLVTYAGSGFPTLDSTIIETMNRDDVMPDHKQYMSIMGYKETNLVSKDQSFAAKSAPTGMKNMLDAGTTELKDMIFTPKKGIYQQPMGAKYQRSDLFTEWARHSRTIEGANGTIQAELLDTASNMRELALAYDIRWAEDLVKVWANGFSITAAQGPGSATPKGKALFDTHTYGVGALAGTFTNYTNGALTFTSSSTDILAGTTRLQTLINQLKQAKDENGKYVRQGGLYKLFCSRVNEVFWRQVLNNESKFSGQGTNAMQENQFLFGGNRVELVVLDILGQPDVYGNAIGTTAMIFVTNASVIAQAEAFRAFRLHPLKLRSWENMETAVLTTEGRGVIGCDHFGAELYIAGSTCA